MIKENNVALAQPTASAQCWSSIGRLAAPLQSGSKGSQVTKLQTLLGVTPDGVFGPATEHALKTSFVAATLATAIASEASTMLPAALTTAQAILETGYGRRVPTDINSGIYSYNLFGIKSRPRQPFVTIHTHEVTNGISEQVQCKFAAYDNFEQSHDAHAAFFSVNPRYHTLFNSSDPLYWANELHHMGYATDPDYGEKLHALMRQWNLV